MLAACIAMLALLGAACGDADSETTDSTSATTSSSTTVNADADTDTADPDEPPPTPTLTASAPGVTETAIRIGVLRVDAEELADLGVVINTGDIEGQWQSFIDAANDAGGVLGRQLEPHFVTYSALSDEAAEEACVKLTEDVDVFWVGGTILRDNAVCLVDLQETAAFSTQAASPTAVQRTRVPFRSLFPSQTDQAAVFARASAAAGIYHETPVGIIQAGADPGPVAVVAEALREEGLSVIEGAINAAAGDQLAVERETLALFERFRVEGVETVVLAGIGAGPLEIAQDSGFSEFDFAMTTALNAGIIERQGIDPALLDGVFSVAESLVGTVDQERMAELPAVQRCVGIYEANAGPGTVEFDPRTGLENLGPTLQACDLIDVFVATASAAGVDLTNATFGTALDEMGELDLATVPFASGSAQKFGLSDSAVPVRYDADELLWAVIDEPIDTSL